MWQEQSCCIRPSKLKGLCPHSPQCTRAITAESPQPLQLGEVAVEVREGREDVSTLPNHRRRPHMLGTERRQRRHAEQPCGPTAHPGEFPIVLRTTASGSASYDTARLSPEKRSGNGAQSSAGCCLAPSKRLFSNGLWVLTEADPDLLSEKVEGAEEGGLAPRGEGEARQPPDRDRVRLRANGAQDRVSLPRSAVLVNLRVFVLGCFLLLALSRTCSRRGLRIWAA